MFNTYTYYIQRIVLWKWKKDTLIYVSTSNKIHCPNYRSTIVTYTNTKHGLDLDKIMVKKYIERTFSWTMNYGKHMA